jgi:hypothetical protein
VDLDSSSPHKFSRHLIVHTPGAIFLNNFHGMLRALLRFPPCAYGAFAVGYFVHALVSRLEQQRSTNPSIQSLFVRDSFGVEKIFCDMGVYTKNRLFRIWGSTKRGKSLFLRPAAQNTYPFSGERDLFLASLVCFVAPPPPPRAVSVPVPAPPAVTTPAADDDLDAALAALPDTALQRTPARVGGMRLLMCEPPLVMPASCSRAMQRPSGAVSTGGALSPYPALDRFVLGLVNEGVLSGTIRSWMLYADKRTVVYRYRETVSVFSVLVF